MKSIIEAYKQVIAKQNAPASVLNETTLQPHEQDIIDNYVSDHNISEGTDEKIQKALGPNQFAHFPLPTQSEIHPDADVAEHLATHGYDIDDYKKGIAAKKTVVGDPSRGIPHREKVIKQSIASVLDKTGAEDHIKKLFINDPARSSTKSADANPLHVVITKTPYGVGGMSTGTHWTSCMNLHDGVNRHHIEDDIASGTHVAYLCHHDDETAFKHGEPSKPIARIALKPFHASVDDEEDDTNPAYHEGRDTIFRPELSTYGNSTPAFVHAVSQWAVKHYPARPGTTYHKDSSVYDDSGNNRYHTDTLPNMIEKIDRGDLPVLDRGDMLDHHLIDGLVKHITANPTQRKIENALSIGNLNTKHIVDLHRSAKDFAPETKRSLIWSMAVPHGDKFSTNMHNEFSNYHPDSHPPALLRSSKLPDSVIDNLPVEKLKYVQRSRIKDSHVDKVVDAAVNHESGSFYNTREMAWAMKSHHLDKLVNAGYGGEIFVANHPELSKDAFKKALSTAKDALQTRVLLSQAKHARFEDFAPHGNSALAFNGFANNPHLTDIDKKKLANHYMKQVDRYVAPSVNAYSTANANKIVANVPDSIGDLIDHEKLAKANIFPSIRFDNPEHSWKHVDALYDHALKTDEHYDKFLNGDNDSFNEDDHWTAMGRYHDALTKHFEDHVVGEYNSIQNHEHFNRILNRMDEHNSSFMHDGDSFYNLHHTLRDYE